MHVKVSPNIRRFGISIKGSGTLIFGDCLLTRARDLKSVSGRSTRDRTSCRAYLPVGITVLCFTVAFKRMKSVPEKQLVRCGARSLYRACDLEGQELQMVGVHS